MSPLRQAVLAAALYLATAVALSGCRPLWLDEVLQLIDTCQPSAAELVARLPAHHTGSAPLGYLTQQFGLRISGYSIRRARLTAAIFGTAAVLATVFLAAELGLSAGWAGWIFAILPLTVRYATEARMYSQALFFCVLATILYVRLSRRPGWLLAVAYALALTAAAYTQPYAASVGLAHVLWSLACRERKTVLFGGSAVSVSILAYLPWYLSAKDQWAVGAASHGLHFSASVKTPLMLFRELAGAGYWGSALLLILCAFALFGNSGLTRRTKTLLVFLIAVPLLSVFAADALFGYFLAARQFLWTLPAVALLTASASRRRPAVRGVLVLLSAVCIWQNTLFFRAPHEDWQTASDAIQAQTQRGACLSVTPPEQRALYAFFHPELRRAPCGGNRWILALTPYTTREQRDAALALLQLRGYRRQDTTLIGGTTLIGFRR